MLVAAALTAAAGYLIRRRDSHPRLPPGYTAVGLELVNGYPKVIARGPDGPRFIRIEGGTFKMGNDGFAGSGSEEDDDQPAHRVELSDFYMQETEVTNGEMEAYFRQTKFPRERWPERWKRFRNLLESEGREFELHPAVGISHAMAADYARWVGGKLPTEAQWEFAARSRGKPIPYVWGDEPRKTAVYANVNSAGTGDRAWTVKVKDRPRDRTEQRIYDLMGNVREWCRDVWFEYKNSEAPQRNPQGPPPPEDGRFEYVVRGASHLWWADDKYTTTTRPRRAEGLTADELKGDGTAQDVGFRVVIEWPSQT
jgi:serine/threonine-protein kinase